MNKPGAATVMKHEVIEKIVVTGIRASVRARVKILTITCIFKEFNCSLF